MKFINKYYSSYCVNSKKRPYCLMTLHLWKQSSQDCLRVCETHFEFHVKTYHSRKTSNTQQKCWEKAFLNISLLGRLYLLLFDNNSQSESRAKEEDGAPSTSFVEWNNLNHWIKRLVLFRNSSISFNQNSITIHYTKKTFPRNIYFSNKCPFRRKFRTNTWFHNKTLFKSASVYFTQPVYPCFKQQPKKLHEPK